LRLHPSLIAFVESLSADELRGLSRIMVYPGLDRSRVKASIAVFRTHEPEGIGRNGERFGPVLRRPVSADDAKGREQQNPPTLGLFTERHPDIEGSIPTAELDRQITKLRSSGLVGGLHVEHLPAAIPDGDGFRAGEYIVLTTHGATQAERNAWIREKDQRPAVPANVTHL
jgi:hypothetical protein